MIKHDLSRRAALPCHPPPFLTHPSARRGRGSRRPVPVGYTSPGNELPRGRNPRQRDAAAGCGWFKGGGGGRELGAACAEGLGRKCPGGRGGGCGGGELQRRGWRREFRAPRELDIEFVGRGGVHGGWVRRARHRVAVTVCAEYSVLVCVSVCVCVVTCVCVCVLTRAWL